ncbi:uncharacterized protein F4812DRAFT_461249 [Daldinia caldariorum]|uniref:uncharacterized protein n=1 Tax=Daldinia caldariorum TaxID=326644 RepID=UPI0020079F89|nr:uncharacterized protein F4812DRAFT_461249 [Daldinia caldariorum]KAI1465557.1 hypothetical protein F4812DRAFT_461249 [Daldinia caldariorum]
MPRNMRSPAKHHQMVLPPPPARSANPHRRAEIAADPTASKDQAAEQVEHTDGGLALTEYHYPEDNQQDHGPAPVSLGLAEEPLVSFVTDPPTEEQPAAATDGYWTWSDSHGKW